MREIINREIFTKRLRNKEWMENAIITTISDLFMIALAVIVGYYIRRFMIGF